jgi:fumarate hydratase subunit beta
MININTPLDDKTILDLRTGDEVTLTGTVFTARDQAHKRMVEALQQGKALPFDLTGQIIYYCGPTQAMPGTIIGSCGPTTSSRMDAFTPILLKNGLKGMIGKGARCADVIAAIKRERAVYFLTYAGCGALLTRYVRKTQVVAYPELGPEAVHRLDVVDFPLIVGIDSRGRSIY